MKKVVSAAMSAMLLGMTFGINPAYSVPQRQLKMPTVLPTPRRYNRAEYGYTPDILLVMPDKKAEEDDIKKTLEEAHGTVIGTVGQGALKVLVIRTEKGKLEETEKTLKK